MHAIKFLQATVYYSRYYNYFYKVSMLQNELHSAITSLYHNWNNLCTTAVFIKEQSLPVHMFIKLQATHILVLKQMAWITSEGDLKNVHIV